MNLLLIGNHFAGPGRNQNAWQDIAQHLRRAGHCVLTASSKPNKYIRLLDMLSTILLHQNQYQIAEVDVFSGQAFYWAEASCAALRALGKKYILTLHGGELPSFARHRQKRVRRLLNSAEAVTAPSRYLAEMMRPYRSDIRLLPNPIEISAYPFHQRKYVRATLIWLRAFHAIYNPTLAPKVIELLAPDFPEIHLSMVGPDKGDGSLLAVKRSSAQLSLTQCISFPGAIPKSQVPKTLGEADIFINTTNIDNTPISVIEAMSCGLCIVSTNVGGIPFLLQDGVDALLVPPDDPVEMAKGVRRILTEPALAARLSWNARQKAEHFDWSLILPMWEQIFSKGIRP